MIAPLVTSGQEQPTKEGFTTADSRPSSIVPDTLSRGLGPALQTNRPDRQQGVPDSVPASSTPIGPEAHQAGRRFAVCIGINHYLPGSGYSDLQYAATDAAAMAKAFLANAEFENVLLICDADVPSDLQSKYKERLTCTNDTKRFSIIPQIEDFVGKAKRYDDALVFYFAGHGDADGNRAFLIPSDHKPGSLGITLATVFDAMKLVRANNKLIIIDACRSAVTSERLGRPMARNFRSELFQADESWSVFTGCAEDQFSYEDPAVSHGRFTWALLDAFTGNGFLPGQIQLRTTDLFDHVRKYFKEHDWDLKQKPLQYSLGNSFPIAFRRSPPPNPFSEIQHELLRTAQKRGQELYRARKLGDAVQAFQFALNAIGDSATQDPKLQLANSQLLLEQALAFYRMGRSDESRTLREKAAQYRFVSAPLLQLEGCDLADAREYEKAIAKFQAAIDLVGDPAEVDGHLWSRKAALEAAVFRYAAAVQSYGQAAKAEHRAGNKQIATEFFAEMRRLDFQRVWLEQSRLTDRPDAGVEAAAATYACAREIFGEDYWRTTEAKVLFEAVRRQSTLPAASLRTILELETLFNRFGSGRDTDALSIIRLLNSQETKVHGLSHPWCANSLSLMGKRLTNLKRHAEAVETFQRAQTIYQTHYGALHPNTIRVEARLAAALKSAGKRKEAEELLGTVRPRLEGLIRLLGDEREAQATWELAQILYMAESQQRAIPYFERATSEYDAVRNPVSAAWMQGWVGSCYRDLKQDEQALKHYEVAIQRFRDINHDEGIAAETDNAGRALYRLKRYDEAIARFETAAALYSKTDIDDEAWMHDWIGDSLRRLKRSREAIPRYERALATFEKLGQPADIAEVRYEIADSVYEAGDLALSLVLFEQVIPLCEQANLPLKAAWAQAMQGLCQKKLTKDELALANFRGALDRFGKVKHEEDISPVFVLTGQMLKRLGRDEESLSYFEQAATADEARGRKQYAAYSHLQRATSFQTLKRPEEARVARELAVGILQRLPTRDAATESTLGQALFALARHAEALPHFTAAIPAYDKEEKLVDAAWMSAWQGDCYAKLNRDEEAAKSYEDCLRRFSQIDYRDDFTHVYRDLGDTLRKLRRFSDAIPHFETAVKLYTSQNKPIDAAWMRDRIGGCYRDLKKDEVAVEIYAETLATFKTLNYRPGVAEESSDLGQAYVRLKRFAEAVPLFQAAAEAYREEKDAPTAARMLSWLGDCHRELRDDDKAVATYRMSVAAFTELKNNDGIADDASDLGKALHRLKKYHEALEPFQTAYNAYVALKKPRDAAWMQDWIAGCHRELKQHAKAVEYYQPAFAYFLEIKDTAGIAEEGFDLGQALVRTQRYAEAITPLQAAAQARDELNNSLDAAWARSWLGDCHRDLDQDEQAVVAYQRSFATFQELKHVAGIADDGFDLGRALYRLKRYDEAAPPLLAAVAAYEERKEQDVAAQGRVSLGHVYRELGQFESAFKHVDLALAYYSLQPQPLTVGQIAERFGRDLAKLHPADARRYLVEAEQAYRKANKTENADEVRKALAELGGPLVPPLLAP